MQKLVFKCFLNVWSKWLKPFIFHYSDIDDCESQPCQNNGTCTNMINDYLCHCTVGFNGRNCSNSKSGYDFLF